MITSVAASTDTTVTSSTTSSSSTTSTVYTPFGELLVENLASSSPVIVGYVSPKDEASTSSSSASASALSTSSSTSSSSSSSSSSTDEYGIDASSVPTAESFFGSSVWVSSVTETSPAGTFNLNSDYFATDTTAEKLASMIGGTVVDEDALFSGSGNPVSQSTTNAMIELSDGKEINAGLVATFFTHGYSGSMIQSMISNEIANVEKGN